MTVTHERPVEAAVDLAEKVAFLRRPEVHADGSAGIEAIETHMAWVFLSRTHAWKLKKPVRYSYLDFSTLEARRRDCAEEVRLNARLAPNVYLGTVPLTFGGSGLALDGHGEVVDWLVAMRRLDRKRTLERALVRGDWKRDDLNHVVAWLAAFYARAARPAISPTHYRARLRDEILESRHDIDALVGGSGGEPPTPTRIARHLLRFLDDAASMFDERVLAGRVVDGHGDLRPEHIFSGAPPAIIDCIEFNASFRVLDIVEDLAFLVIECERLGAPDAGRTILERYTELADDSVPVALTAFHAAQRALLRAKIAIWHVREEDGRRQHWMERCHEYLRLAERRITAIRHDTGR